MISKKTRELLEEYSTKCLNAVGVEAGQGFCIGDGVKDPIISEVQENAGLEFSTEYIYFLKNYGETTIRSYDIYGLAEISMHGKKSSVIDQTNFYKHDQKWPDIDDWYIISDDGRGNPIGCKPDGSVWLSDHDAGFEQVKLADSFEEFLHKLLTDTLYQ